MPTLPEHLIRTECADVKIHPLVMATLGERHTVTTEGECLFDAETLGNPEPDVHSFQRYDASADDLWQINEMRSGLRIILPLVEYGESSDPMGRAVAHQALYHKRLRSGGNAIDVYYWLQCDATCMVTRITIVRTEAEIAAQRFVHKLGSTDLLDYLAKQGVAHRFTLDDIDDPRLGSQHNDEQLRDMAIKARVAQTATWSQA